MCKENNKFVGDAIIETIYRLMGDVSELQKLCIKLETRCNELDLQLRQIKSEQSDKSDSAVQSDKTVELPEDIVEFLRSFGIVSCEGLSCSNCVASRREGYCFSCIAFSLAEKYGVLR